MSARTQLNYLDSAAEVYALGLYYEREYDDPELLRRIEVRIANEGVVTVDAVRDRIAARMSALCEEHAVPGRKGSSE